MARQLARRRTRERIAGIALAALGVVVLAVAIFAVRNPHSGSGTAAAGTSTTPAPAASSAGAKRTGSSAPSHPVSGSTVPITANSTGGAGTMSLAAAQKTPLIVLNNSMVTGLAAKASQQFQNAGWTVTRYGNLQNDIISTCAYFDPADPTAKAAAKVLKHEFPGIKRVRPKFPQLPAGPIIVVLTSDYSAQ